MKPIAALYRNAMVPKAAAEPVAIVAFNLDRRVVVILADGSIRTVPEADVDVVWGTSWDDPGPEIAIRETIELAKRFAELA